MTIPNDPKDQGSFDADTDYRAIEQALLETPRGRWFLAEHGRRARRLDSAALDEAVQRLNSSLRQPPALLGALQRAVESLGSQIAEAREAIFAKPVQVQTADAEAVPGTTQTILKSAEDLHELAWSLQANDISPENCENIARNASRIYALAQAQAVEGTRARQFADALDTAATRIVSLLETIEHELQIDGGEAATASNKAA